VMDERMAAIPGDGDTVYLAGIGDFRSAPHDPRMALAGLPPGANALCFTHSPDVFPLLPDSCALTVAAHTHGGQVRLPLIGRPIVPSHYGQRYAAGIVHEGTKTLFVTTGIGTGILPIRIGVEPEVSILTVE
jgi:predicted MPP superfamily phosphohydrolase